MKRVIAISLLLLAFVCSLHSVDLVIEYLSIEERSDSFTYHLTLQEDPDIEIGRFVFDIHGKPVSMFWTLPEPTAIPEDSTYTLEVISSSFESCYLSFYSKGNYSTWAFTSGSKDPYVLIDFLKILLRDGYIVYSLSDTPLGSSSVQTQRFYLSLSKTEENEKARQEALEKLEIFENYLFLVDYKELFNR